MKRKWSKPVLVAGAILLGLPLIATIVFTIASHLAKATRLTPELKAGPAELRLRANPQGPERRARQTPELKSLELAGVRNYREYMQARLALEQANPDLALFMEALKRYEEEDIKKGAEKAGFSGTVADEVIPEQAQFLTAHADFLVLLHRLAQGGVIAGPSVQEWTCIKREKATFNIQQGELFMIDAIQLVSNDAWRSARAKDYASSRQSIQDALLLITKMPLRPGLTGQLAKYVFLSTSLGPHWRCIEDPQFPAAELRLLKPALERAEQEALAPERLYQALRETCWLMRAPIIAAMESGTWRQPEFEWEADRKPYLYWSSMNLWKGCKMRVPRVEDYARDAVRAIHNRMEAPEALRKYDAIYMHELESARRMLNGLPDDAQWTTQANYQSFMTKRNGIKASHQDMVKTVYQRHLAVTAWMHLCRIGLGLRLDPKATLARRGEDLRGDPFHPWRDPFTGKALNVVQTTTQTTVYSVGEDRIDQGGDDQKNDDQGIRIAR